MGQNFKLPDRVLERIWKAGFDSGSADGISVPEPIGFIPRFQMWLQRKVPGETATRRLAGPEDVAKVVRFLASSDASYITGTWLAVDGGLLAQG